MDIDVESKILKVSQPSEDERVYTVSYEKVVVATGARVSIDGVEDEDGCLMSIVVVRGG